MTLLSKGLAGDLAHGDAGKILDGGSGGERPMITSPLSLVKVEEHQRSNINSELGRSRERATGFSGVGKIPAPFPAAPGVP